MTKNNEPMLLHFDENGYNQAIEPLYAGIQSIQDTIASYVAMGFEPINNEDLHRLFTEPEMLVFDKLTKGEPIVLQGLELHKDKALELLKKPVGYEAFTSQLSKAIAEIQNERVGNTPLRAAHVTQYYEVDNAGKVALKQSKLDSIKKQFEQYATSDTAKKMLEFATSIVDKANELELMELVMLHPDNLAGVVKSLFDNYYRKPPVISVKTILLYNQDPNRPVIK